MKKKKEAEDKKLAALLKKREREVARAEYVKPYNEKWIDPPPTKKFGKSKKRLRQVNIVHYWKKKDEKVQEED
jgi:hypothetical protein